MHDVRGHHANGGFFFTRVLDGSVIVSYWRGDDCMDSTLLTESEWASVVAYASRRGEDGATWSEALDFHRAGKGT